MSQRYKAGYVTSTLPTSSGVAYTGAASGAWTLQNQMQAVSASLWPRSPGVAGAPTSVVATGGNAQASVAFTAPNDNGGFTITGYTVTASPGGITATGSSSPIVVTGLTNGTAYTFTVTATNSAGVGVASSSSASVTPVADVIGQQAYTTPGTYSWVCPAGVPSVCVVTVGSASSGNGGALSWKNNIPVTAGTSYTVVVASEGSTSYFKDTSTVAAGYYTYGRVGDGGGNGGSNSYGGGGAGGYTGNGGNYNSSGSGGGGGGGSDPSVNSFNYYPVGSNGVDWGYNARNGPGGGGGGVGLLGQGASGSAGGSGGGGGGGGSGGASGGSRYYEFQSGGEGGAYGGGSGSGSGYSAYNAPNPGGYYTSRGSVGTGAVRIIYGLGRSFPSTNTGDL